MKKMSHIVPIIPHETENLNKIILTSEALEFLTELQEEFQSEIADILKQRKLRQQQLNTGKLPDFLSETESIRNDLSWHTPAPPHDLIQRKVEITGPVERKMMINAFNSGADVFMADFEDSLSPTWSNVIQGQVNLIDAVNKTLSYVSPEGKHYTLNEKIATLIVRPRGWHLLEKHVILNDTPLSASLFDFGLYVFHNLKSLLQSGTGPYFYLPKLENHLEARLWNKVFVWTEEKLKVPIGTIKATVLIETILAAFEMEEILYELRDHCIGLNAGRWDYLFSIIKKLRNASQVLLPDRGQITMTVPFMRAYAELLVHTCHKRKAHALGGMAAYIPNRKDKDLNELAIKKVREDKEREAHQGFDGTWVAHPDLVLVAYEAFNQVLPNQPHQKNILKPGIPPDAKAVLNFNIPGSSITEQGLRQNINVSLLYIESWLSGIGAAALYNLMEDAATAEISRAQLWQWLHHKPSITIGSHLFTSEYFSRLCEEEYVKISSLKPLKNLDKAKFLLQKLVLADSFEDFLTIPAYEMIP
jgi:malate synthase